MSFNIPVAVARAVAQSKWAEGRSRDKDTTEGQVLNRLFVASSGRRWARAVDGASFDVLKAFVDSVVAVRDELQAAGRTKKADIGPLDAFLEQMNARIALAEERERVLLEAEAAAVEKQRRIWRADRKKGREQTMPPIFERGRSETLREICEDYGIDPKHPQMRAALIAAFHAGVHNARGAIDALFAVDLTEIPATIEAAARIEQDRIIFARAELEVTDAEA